jgi:ABC-type multidrug transport system fused ATPase/permease subunit
MTLLKLWNYLGFGTLLFSGLTFALLLLSEYSYWLMRCFFAMAGLTAIPLMFLSLIFMVGTALSSLIKEFSWKTVITWRIILWILVFILSSFNFLGSFLKEYEITASASFNNQKYYLVKFNSIDSHKYNLYSCDSLGLLCSRSSGYIGIPYQPESIQLKYNLKTRRVYIQNVDEVIQVPQE